MFHDAQHAARGAMAAQPAKAPIAIAAGEIDFTDYTLAKPLAIGIRAYRDDLTYKFVTGSAGESVVAALEFEIRGADTREQKPDAREARRDARQGLIAKFDPRKTGGRGREMDAEHE